jgi:hypothetical protein
MAAAAVTYGRTLLAGTPADPDLEHAWGHDWRLPDGPLRPAQCARCLRFSDSPLATEGCPPEPWAL